MAIRISAVIAVFVALPLVGAELRSGSVADPLTIPAPAPLMRSKLGPPRGDYTFGFVAGPPWSSGFAIAAALSAAAGQGQEGGPHGEQGPRLAPLPGTSNASNVDDLLSSPSIDLAIVSVPALQRAAKASPGVKSRVAYVAPLFPEEVHLLVKDDISRIDDLRNRKVAMSSPNGDSARLFAALGIPVEIVSIPTASHLPFDSIDAAAVLLISGQPVPELKQARGWKLLPVPFTPALGPDFLPGSIPQSAYPNLISADQIATVSVRSALVAYVWPKKWERSQVFGTVVVGMLDHVADAIGSGATHRLAEVNWAARLPGWRRYEPAEKWIAAHQMQDTTATIPSRKHVR